MIDILIGLTTAGALAGLLLAKGLAATDKFAEALAKKEGK